ncbi:MAG: type II secretion system F family protein [Acidimicrobiia bacterium]
MDVLLLLAGFAALATGGLVALQAIREPEVDAGAVLADLEGGIVLDEFTTTLRQPMVARLLRPLGRQVADRATRLMPRARIESIRHKLLVAGVLHSVGPEEFVVLQAVGAGGGALLGLLLANTNGDEGFALLRMVGMLVAIGFFAPVAWLRRKKDERQSSIRRDLPDVLDLLAISVEAGVGFEGAVGIVCKHFDSPLAHEFSRTLREMELGLPRRDALQNLKRRTEVPELSNFVLILVQADALGMPIGRVLRTQAVEMRTKRRQWAREKAGKLPVKILVPLTLFILPAIFVVVIGPAAISISQGL